MTFFNFIMKDDSFETGYCFEPLNKKALISMLRTGFELMLKYKADEEGRLYLCEQMTGNTCCQRQMRKVLYMVRDHEG